MPRLPAIALLHVCSLSVWAQSYTQLSGVVLDPAEAAVPSASITVVEQDTGFRRAVESSNDGSYLVASLRPGTYKITVRKEGFVTMVRFGLKLDVSQPARLDFRLALGSMQEIVTVEGSPPLLNLEDAAIGTQVDRERIDRLPLNGRGLLSLLELAPGTLITPATRGESGQFTVNGQRPNTHYFTLDGVSVNSGVGGGGGPAQLTGGSLPGMTAIGSLHGIASLDTLAEFRVQTATSAPEFGRMPGAQVVLSSRSGSNELHGAASFYFRDQHLDANDWFLNRVGMARGQMRMDDYAAALGGPVKKDATFFFAAYEGMRLEQPFAWRSAVPTLEARQSAAGWTSQVLNLFPVPNGGALGAGLAEWTGKNERPSQLDTGSLRLDQALGSRVNVFARYSESPSSSEFGNTQIGDLSIGSRSVTGALTWRLRPSIALDVRFNYSDSKASSEWRPATVTLPACFFDSVAKALGRQTQCTYLARFNIAGVGQLIVGPESDRTQSQSHLAATGLLGFGSHQIRTGVDYRRLTPWRRDRAASLSVIAETLPDFINSSSLWVASASPVEAITQLDELSLFAQDTWRMTSRLTATLGARWELSPQPALTTPELGPYQNTGLWKRRFNDVAPRVGLAFRPVADGQLVLRAGAGVYYNSSLSIATDLVNGGPFTLSQYTSNKGGIFASVLGYAFDENLRTPWVTEWSFLAERSFAGSSVLSAGYSGSMGNSLIRRELGSPFSSERLQLVLATNHGESSYQALELQYRGRVGSRFHTVTSYTWSHSIDNSSSDSALHWNSATWSAINDRGASDFDVRHNLTAAVTYETQRQSRAWWQSLVGGWQTDGIFRLRSGFPIEIANGETATGLTYANAFRPNLMTNVPLWLEDGNVPGGRKLNPAAFRVLPSGSQGNLGRNVIRGFGSAQFDVALRREFPFRERARLLFGVEGFNVFNHPQFADPIRFLSSPLFGQSPSSLNLMLGTGTPGTGLTPVFQSGGARSLQLVLRLRF